MAEETKPIAVETVRDIRRKTRTLIERRAGEVFRGRESSNDLGRIEGRRQDLGNLLARRPISKYILQMAQRIS
jgi:hypothetical protein